MVDNFDKIRSLLKFENPGDCYYVQLLRRQSDDPMIDGKPDPNYHGNMHSRSIKDYLIPDIAYFDKKKDEIKKICDTFNVRAYIRLNKRNYQQISFNMAKHVMEQACSGQTFNSPYSLVASAAGNANCAGKDKTWICDLDEEYLPYKQQIIDMMCECEPHKSNIQKEIEFSCGSVNKVVEYRCKNDEEIKNLYIDREFFTVPTKHGIHIICKPFNTADFKSKWDEFAKTQQIVAPLPQVAHTQMHVNGVDYTTHFSLTDVYLKRVAAFDAVCKSCSKHAIVDVIDKNKTIIHCDETCDTAKLAADWRDYCLKIGFYMKCFDIHKDNPSLLYCS